MVRAGGDGELTWVLLAANGRPLARSAAAYRSEEALDAAWRELVADREALSIRLGRGDPGWWWSAALPVRVTGTGMSAGVVVARSARGYLRPDQCRGNASGFLNALSGFARRGR